jgi:hypothetical protein
MKAALTSRVLATKFRDVLQFGDAACFAVQGRCSSRDRCAPAGQFLKTRDLLRQFRFCSLCDLPSTKPFSQEEW